VFQLCRTRFLRMLGLAGCDKDTGMVSLLCAGMRHYATTLRVRLESRCQYRHSVSDHMKRARCFPTCSALSMPIWANISGALRSAASISISAAVCHSGWCCTFSGSAET
jgi:hypothetical protein